MTTNLPAVSKSDYQEAKDFLRALFGRYFENNDGFVEFRFLNPEKGGVERAFARQGKLDKDGWAGVVERGRKAHVFFGVNPRQDFSGRAVDIENIVCLWVDVDGKEEGGKEAAYSRVRAFNPEPSILIDSGHGYHCYWLLKRPLLAITDGQRLEIRQILSGLIKALGGDRARTDLSSCLRLPGTMNIKPGLEPVRCATIHCRPEVTFNLEEFEKFRDQEFKEPEGCDDEIPPFGVKNLIVSSESEPEAIKAVDELCLPQAKTRTMILTGKAIRLKDMSDSGRDLSIISSLVWAGYGYATIKSIFFNRYLKCSNRIQREGERALKWDVLKALKGYEKFKLHGTPQSREILDIKNNPFLTPAEKLGKIKEYVVADLLTGPTPLGNGFYESEGGPFYIFHLEERELIDLDSDTFDYFLEGRYVTNRADSEEILRALKAAILSSKKKVVTQFLHYFDEEKGVLYVDDGAQGIYRVDGHEISLLNNGDEGVFFKRCDILTPFKFLAEFAVVEAFRADPPDGYPGRPDYPLGLSLEKFYSDKCLLNKHLISQASFATLEESNISPEEQKLLLILYFYSLFFESIFTGKPVAAFVGKLQSGKSFLATTIGKVLFGRDFTLTAFPNNNDSLRTVLHEKRFVVLDDVKRIPNDEMLGTLDAYSTSRPEMGKRGEYTSTTVKGVPRVFFALTAVEMKGWDDQFLRRVLLFNTKGLTSVRPEEELWRPIFEDRDRLMTEILVNLKSVVALIQRYRRFSPENPPNITASWASFAQKVTAWAGTRVMLRRTFSKLVAKKADALLDADPLWWVLEYILINKETNIEPISTATLYQMLVSTAEDMEILREFKQRYSDVSTLGKHLVNIQEELSKRVDVETAMARSRIRLWGFKAREEMARERPKSIPDTVDWKALEEATALDFEPSGGADHLDPERELAIMEAFGWTEENLAEVELAELERELKETISD